MVLGVQPGMPPFRIVEIDGEVVGAARALTDVLTVAAAAGITVHDLDDPDTVRWVGGDKLTGRGSRVGQARCPLGACTARLSRRPRSR